VQVIPAESSGSKQEDFGKENYDFGLLNILRSDFLHVVKSYDMGLITFQSSKVFFYAKHSQEMSASLPNEREYSLLTGIWKMRFKFLFILLRGHPSKV
jgi:hypothetical protein